MKRRDTVFRAATRPEAARSIVYDDWPALAGGRVEIRRFGSVVQTGVVEVVMPDSSQPRRWDSLPAAKTRPTTKLHT